MGYKVQRINTFAIAVHTLLRSGACGLEGLTGTESPAADGIYITGPVCVGLETADVGCNSSLSGGSVRNFKKTKRNGIPADKRILIAQIRAQGK